MFVFFRNSYNHTTLAAKPGDEAALIRMARQLPPTLSVIAGMVDLTGFFLLGHIFTAHVTGNLVIASAVAVQGGLTNPVQILAIPVFIVALALVWLITRITGLKGAALVRLLMMVQFLLLASVQVFCVIAAPLSNPHTLLAKVAALTAVSAMACQYAMLRLALPKAISTAVMTGNLTTTVLGVMDTLSCGHPLMSTDDIRLKQSLCLLLGFLLGCVIAAIAILTIGHWAWLLPTTLAAIVAVQPEIGAGDHDVA